MNLRINDLAPDFRANTTHGAIDFHDWIGDAWAVLFSHPKDFTPVCTTELAYLASQHAEFAKRNCRIIGLSVDAIRDHEAWMKDIASIHGVEVDYPLIADDDFSVAKLYGMLPAATGGDAAERSAADNATVRTVFVIGPDKLIKMMLAYPMSSGRNFDEVLRMLDSLQLTARHRVATPANWRFGEPVIIAPAVADDEARRLHPQGWEAVTPYLRYVPQPAEAV